MDLRNDQDRRLVLGFAGVLLSTALVVGLFIRELWKDDYDLGPRPEDPPLDEKSSGRQQDYL